MILGCYNLILKIKIEYIIDPFLDPQVETGGDSRFFEFPGP